MVTYTFLSNKGEGPSKDVHEVGQPIGMRGAVELSDVHYVVLVLENSGYRESRGRTVKTNIIYYIYMYNTVICKRFITHFHSKILFCFLTRIIGGPRRAIVYNLQTNRHQMAPVSPG